MKQNRPLSTRLMGVFLLSLAGLSACTVVVDEPRPRPRPVEPQMCTMEYAPVCGQRGARRQTFPNACQARVDGFEVIGRGECRPARPDYGRPGDGRPGDGRPGDGRPDFERPDEGRPGEGRPDRGPRACTREFAPVCARQGRREQTFANACMAEADGFRVIGRGDCR